MSLLEKLKKEKEYVFKNSELYKRIQGKNLVIFSASIGGRNLINFFRSNNVEIKYIIDNNPQLNNTVLNDIQIVLPNNLENYLNIKDTVAVLGSISYLGEMRNQLLELGFERKNILNPHLISQKYAYFLVEDINDRKIIENNIEYIDKVYNILDDNESKFTYEKVVQDRYNEYLDSEKSEAEITIPIQYFDPSLLKFENNEIFMDVGAFDGDSILAFIKRVNNKYKHIYAFEPEEKLYNEVINTTNGLNNITIIKKGLSNSQGLVNFCNEGAASHINRNGNSYGKTIQIDKGDNYNITPTFIKMDIEGEEVRALEGLQETIKRCKPKLAICIYHRNEYEQLWQVPLFIKMLVPEYKIRIRQHGYDTVCYATI